jgi:hypothetical protein
MAAPELICRAIEIDFKRFSKAELSILEAELFSKMYSELKEFFRKQLKDYFELMKFNIEMENNMLDTHFMSNLVNDILITQQYTIEGIACYTNSFEEVIVDIASGKNLYPSFPLGRKIIDLHRSVRPKLYEEIIKRIISA